ncbi:PTS system IIA component, Glc family [Carnobacterium iners]|uniref:PTS system IIA component, Glc family n=2 Tax=Carnobacterium iners TaxID=1073423 RepID=A0A1X7MRG1_9LACT|nr:PTS system IIA component, Glc family [Carnobacterium iners]SMH27412.1 PTS system IIA component, Glc family [Carnobacterium iners]
MIMLSKNSAQETNVEETIKTELYAVTDGKIISIEDVKDPVFSEKMMGDGFAIEPTSESVLSPVSGRLFQVADALHAYGIVTDKGIEVLVHIGLDTVTLRGQGFKSSLKIGMLVKRGELLATVDFDYLIEQEKELTISVVIINGCSDLYRYELNPEAKALAGETIVLTVFKKTGK